MTFRSVHVWSLVPVPMVIDQTSSGLEFCLLSNSKLWLSLSNFNPSCFTTVKLLLTLLTALWSHRDVQWLNLVFFSVNFSLWFYFPLHIWSIISTVSQEQQKLLRFFFLFLNLSSSSKTHISLIIIFLFLHQDNFQIDFECHYKWVLDPRLSLTIILPIAAQVFFPVPCTYSKYSHLLSVIFIWDIPPIPQTQLFRN